MQNAAFLVMLSMKAILKNPYKLAGLLLLSVWLVFSVCNLFCAIAGREELIEDLENETDLKGVIEDVDEFISEEIALRQPIIETYGVMQRAMGKHELNNMDLIEDKLGFLHNGNFYADFGDDQRKIAINFRLLNDYAAQYGAQTGVVITPMKIAPEDARYLGLPYDSSYHEADDLLAWLRHYNVHCMDMRDLPAESGLGYEQSFYKTDHHWTTPAAFDAYCRIINWLEQSEGLKLASTAVTSDINNYAVENYPSLMLGSQGRDAGLYYSRGTEDFSIYYPLDNGDYVLRTRDNGEWREYSGGFRGALVRDRFEETVRDRLFTVSCYDLSFLRGLHDEISIENQNLPDGAKVLIICDSYSLPLGCYLAQNFGRIDMVYALGSRMDNVLKMIEENSYDYVLACIYPENLSVENYRLFEDLDYA